ncbi:MAG: transposase [Candidatus Staskawiczbacteria bacterium]|nr:transposase [Candidatus Staskawiczbacteria bacterium]
MPYRKEYLANGEIYHVILRGLDDNLIFKDVSDYYRGIFSVYEFNNLNPTTIQARRKIRANLKKKNNKAAKMEVDKRDRFVDILAFCFMPNHIHLLLKQLKENGITKFMSKVGTGYAGYFNRKCARKGYVFQNRFRSVHIENDDHLSVIFNYVHANPISLIEPGWKENGIKNPKKAVEFLEEYKWSSYKDYIGQSNFSSVTERNFMFEFLGGVEGSKISIKNWIDYKKKLNQFGNFLLE